MNSVENRKLFANRDARNRLAEMGGIMASSSELLGEAQMYAEGGNVGVDTYVAVIPGINENRPIRLTVDTLVRLQDSFPEIMQQSTVMDLETAVDSGINPSDIRPADAFVERQLSEQMPERAGAASAPVPSGDSRLSSIMSGIRDTLQDVAGVYAGRESDTAVKGTPGASSVIEDAYRTSTVDPNVTLSGPFNPRLNIDTSGISGPLSNVSRETLEPPIKLPGILALAQMTDDEKNTLFQNREDSMFSNVIPSSLSYGKRLLETLIPASRLVTSADSSENPVSTESGLERFERQNIEENPVSAAAKRAEAAELYSKGQRIRNRVVDEGVKAVNDLDVLSGMGVDIGLAASLLGNKFAKTGAGILNLPMGSMEYLQDRKKTFDERKARLGGDGDVRLSNLFPEGDQGPSIQDQIREASLAAIARGSGSDDLAMAPSEVEALIQARMADAPVTATDIGPGPNSVPTSASMGAPRSSDLAAPNVAALNLGAGMGDPAQRPLLSNPDASFESLQSGVEANPIPVTKSRQEERKMLAARPVVQALPVKINPLYSQEEIDAANQTLEAKQELAEEIPAGPKEYFDRSGKLAQESGKATGKVGSLIDAILGPNQTETDTDTETETNTETDTDTETETNTDVTRQDVEVQTPSAGTMRPKIRPENLNIVNKEVNKLIVDADNAAKNPKGAGSSVSVKDYETKFNELLGPMDKGKAKEKWHQMAMIGFAIAAGQSPDALTNIASGLLEGTKMAKLDRDEANKFNKEMAILQFTERNKDKRLEARLRASAASAASGSGKYTTERERTRLKEAIFTNPEAYPGLQDDNGMIDPKKVNRFLDQVTQVESSPAPGDIVTYQGKKYRFMGGENIKDNYELVG